MSPAVAIAVFGVQAALMVVDEFHFHRERRLPRWERIGHPLDTMSVFACYAVVLAFSPSDRAVGSYVALAAFSCVFVTKDEIVHARLCGPAEHWLHAVLFVLHPVVLALAALLWVQGGHRALLAAQALVTLAFGVYQAVYWNLRWKKQPSFDP
jgi:hypothetical protein